MGPESPFMRTRWRSHNYLQDLPRAVDVRVPVHPVPKCDSCTYVCTHVCAIHVLICACTVWWPQLPFLPSGDFEVKVSITDSTNVEMFCVDVQFSM